MFLFNAHRPPHSIETLRAVADKTSGIPAYLPNCLLLKDTIRKAQEWLQEAEELQVRTHFILHVCGVMTVGGIISVILCV